MPDSHFVSFDVGSVRVGVALAHHIARMPRPLQTLPNNEALWSSIQDILTEYNACQIVIGLPQNSSGADTEQTKYVRAFVETLQQHTSVPIEFQDEGRSSITAEHMLRSEGGEYQKADIDKYAAAIILEDYLSEHKQ